MLGNNVEQDVTRIFLKPLNVFIGNKEQRNIGKMIKVKGNSNNNKFLLGCQIVSRNVSGRSKLKMKDPSKMKRQKHFTQMSD